jgi:hypothetical protein
VRVASLDAALWLCVCVRVGTMKDQMAALSRMVKGGQPGSGPGGMPTAAEMNAAQVARATAGRKNKTEAWREAQAAAKKGGGGGGGGGFGGGAKAAAPAAPPPAKKGFGKKK